MKALVWLSSFVYFVSVLVYGFIAAIMLFLVFMPDTQMAHGIEVEPVTLKTRFETLIGFIIFSMVALNSYFAAQQSLHCILLANLIFVVLLIILSASFLWYLVLLFTLPPVVIVLNEVMRVKSM